MASYPIYNPETGEKKVIHMSVNEITEWYENNKPWIRDWSQGCASAISEVGDWRNKVPSPVREKLKTIKQNHYGSTIDV